MKCAGTRYRGAARAAHTCAMDRLKALEIFKTVADKRSFVKAAEALNLSNPVVSRSVRELEAVLGVRLMQRTTRRVALTAEGLDVLERARRLLDSYAELTAASSQSASDMAGAIRLTAPSYFGVLPLAPVLSGFMAEHPRVQVELLLTDEPLDLVAQSIDLAVRVADELPGSLIARRAGEVRFGVYGAPHYLRSRGLPRQPSDLAQHVCLVHGVRGRSRAWRFSHPVTQQAIEIDVPATLQASDTHALLAAARHGSGLALLPAALAEPALQQGELQQVLGAWGPAPVGVHLAYCSRRQPLRVRRLMERFAEAFDAPPPAALPGPVPALA